MHFCVPELKLLGNMLSHVLEAYQGFAVLGLCCLAFLVRLWYFSVQSSRDYWRLLEITGDYWRLLEITGDY